ncbi:MAG: hypothetical protein AAFR29_03055 [Pseudomonadota bacterium]
MKKVFRIGAALSVASITLGSAIAASAQDTTASDGKRKDRAARMIERFDSNGDGAIDQFEIDQERTKRFEKMDADRNGFVTRAEARDDADRRRAERRKKMDERRAERRDRYDALSDDERAALRERRKDKKGKRRRGGKRRAIDADRMFDRTDENGDGQISLAEFSARGGDRLMRADENADGRVTAEELKAYAKERSKNRRGGPRGRRSRGDE